MGFMMTSLRNWVLGMKDIASYERIAVPYPGGHLPGFRLQAKGKELSTFIFHVMRIPRERGRRRKQ